MATSGQIYTSQSVSGRGAYLTQSIYLKWDLISQDIATNTSNVKFTLEHKASGNGYAEASVDYNYNIKVEGKDYNGTATSTFTPANNTTNTLAQINVPMQHSADGSKSFSYSFSIDDGNYEKSGTGVLDIIPKAATIVSATDFNDEGNPVLNYSNISGTAVTALQTSIQTPSGSILGYWRALSLTGSTYTYDLSTYEQKRIRNYITIGDSAPIRIYLRTTIGDYVESKYIVKTVSLINHTPTLSPVITEANEQVAALTGSDDIIVRYHSNLYISSGAEARKEATITSQSIQCGTKAATTSPTTLYGVDDSQITFNVTDSRGISTTEVITKTLIEYIPLTCNLAANPIGSGGSTTLTIRGNCFNGSFGAVNNTLTIRYRYKTDGAYSNWITKTATIDAGNTYDVSYLVSGLDYTKEYTFEAQAEDRLETKTSAEVKTFFKPIFDWSKEDFNFNVPVTFSAGFNMPNRAIKQLWNGQAKLYNSSGVTGDDTIPLIEPVSAQANGIVLIFTPYNASTGLANDAKLQAFFIPKMTVFVMPNKMHTFQLIDGSNFAKIGAKSVYIGDERISGYANNKNTGTTNGITYDNTAFCLRYIIGV